MSFYCPYCNRERSGKKNTDEEKTKEHFIPESIGGKWVISVCRSCNEFAGKTSDAFFAKASRLYDFFKSGLIRTEGIAELKDGTSANVYFKYQETRKGHHQLHHCVSLKTNKPIDKKDINSLSYQIHNPEETVGSYPTFLKIALGGVYYLLKRNMMWTTQNEKLFRGLLFADLRKKIARKFYPGGKGKGSGVFLRSLDSDGAEKLLNKRKKPNVRRHYISIENDQQGLLVTECLFSMFFWHILIPNLKLEIEGKMEDEILLKDLRPEEPRKAIKSMYIKKDWGIKLELS